MKVMIVEDDRTIAEAVAAELRKWGLEAVCTERFDLVLQQFLQEEPHLVVMDIQLPAYDGFYWCSRIREVSNAPILFLSSRDTPMDMIMSMNTGGDDYMSKPFRADVLSAKIQAMLRRAYAYTNVHHRVLQHQGVILNLEDGHVRSGDAKCELTKTEFLIMRMLMRHKETIVSRHKLMRSLWEDESFIDDNTLTVNIARLRKKLALLGKEDFVQTRKGQGYLIP